MHTACSWWNVPLMAGRMPSIHVHTSNPLSSRQITGKHQTTTRNRQRSSKDPVNSCHSVGVKNPITNFGTFHRLLIE